MNKHFILLILVLIFQQISIAQDKKQPKVIEILSANELVYSKKLKDAQRLIGNVAFKHDNTIMYCDSAMLFTKQNRFQAYGHIHVKRGDTLNLFGDSLHYFVKNKLCRMWGHIRMVENDLQLSTDSIQFDGKENKVWYTGGATISSIRNGIKLKSQKGIYYSSSKTIYFSKNVELEGEDYTMTSDTLEYHTETETSKFHGPTVIRTDESTMYCEAGWYDTKNEKSFFRKNAFIHSKEHFLRGDSIYYDRNTGKGNVYGNLELKDTLQDFILYGGKSDFDQKENYFLVTRKPLLAKIIRSKNDEDEVDTLFLYADTLEAKQDTLQNKSWLNCYHRIKFFKKDLQGKCDSLYYSESDSLMQMFGKPIIWSEGSQLSSEKIKVKTIDGDIFSAQLEESCFIISKADTVGFNQVKGKNIHVWMKDNNVKKALVEGNGQTIYYAGEKGKPFKGMNKSDCSNILVRFNEDEPSEITFLTDPDAVFYPIDKINPKDKLLKDFKWDETHRPKSRKDLLPIK